MKRCNSCFINKPLTEFSKASTCVDGHRNYCKACQKLRKDAWRLANKEHHNQKGKVWVKNNPEKRKVTCLKWYNKNKEYISEYHTIWRQTNKDKVNLSTATRRRRARQATPKWVDMSAIRNLYREAITRGLEVDHIIPIKHPLVCGLHVLENLQLLTKSENCIKSNKFTVEEV